jgi:hypothetical protein
MKQITTFWNYFQKNEQAILNALLLGINTDEVLTQISRKLDTISKRIDFVIKAPITVNDKFIIIFTCYGYRKLFPKVVSIENQAPTLKYFTAQAFIKPLEEITKYNDGTDEPCICKNYQIKISEIQIALLDYNIESKHLKINIYLPHYNKLKQFDDLKSNIDWIIMQIIGEIAFRKHIQQIKIYQLPFEVNGLLSLVELPYFIDYLYKINTRQI